MKWRTIESVPLSGSQTIRTNGRIGFVFEQIRLGKHVCDPMVLPMQAK